MNKTSITVTEASRNFPDCAPRCWYGSILAIVRSSTIRDSPKSNARWASRT